MIAKTHFWHPSCFISFISYSLFTFGIHYSVFVIFIFQETYILIIKASSPLKLSAVAKAWWNLGTSWQVNICWSRHKTLKSFCDWRTKGHEKNVRENNLKHQPPAQTVKFYTTEENSGKEQRIQIMKHLMFAIIFFLDSKRIITSL